MVLAASFRRRVTTLRQRRFASQLILTVIATLLGVSIYRKWRLGESCKEFFPVKQRPEGELRHLMSDDFLDLSKSQGLEYKDSVSSRKNRVNSNENNKELLDKYITFYNRLGGAWSGTRTLMEAIHEAKEGKLAQDLWNRTTELREILHSSHSSATSQNENFSKGRIIIPKHEKARVVVATVACGKSAADALVMLKSAVIFSRDSNLHIIIFSDVTTLPALAQAVLELKWRVNSIHWDFTYEFHKAWFPEDDETDWKNIYSLCSSQRLFFPSLLPDVDALIYLDADTIIVSNLTEIWDNFKSMNDQHIVAMAPNNIHPANGVYNLFSKIPFYQPRGLNSGVILMNLTRMREFELQKKTFAVFNVYKEKIDMPDQDVYNIIFNAYPEKLMLLSCTYNFMYVFCGEAKKIQGGSSDELLYICVYESTPGPKCFCEDSVQIGVRIVHGVSNTFHASHHPFLLSLYENVRKFRIVRDIQGSFTKLLTDLYKEFLEVEDQCFHLTANMLYGNAKTYLRAHNLL